MEILVGSKHLNVDVSCSLCAEGHEYLVVVAKSSWSIPLAGQRPKPLPPEAIEVADVFVGDAANSAMIYGSDLARYKPRCDVLFHAKAHAPDGVPTTEVCVVWQVGPLRKGLRAIGNRKWKIRLGLAYLTDPEPFLEMPLHFGHAFGGTRSYKKRWGSNDQLLADAHPTNPVGLGWFGARNSDKIDGEAAPSLEGLSDPITKPSGKQTPIAFSAIARHWSPRPQYAGTYDAKWREDIFPFLPEDFDEKFHQCAPEDQQMPYPQGGEQVILRNMVAGRPDIRFKLPKLNNILVKTTGSDYNYDEALAAPDTIYFELEKSRFSVVWRVSFKIRKNIQEITKVTVGPVNDLIWKQLLVTSAGCPGCSN